VVRVRRRVLDRLLASLIFLPLRRYSCRSCGWLGNLKQVSAPQRDRGDGRYGARVVRR
jgi:hypothetical protein